MAGDIPVYGANGIVGHHDQSLISGKTIIVGRKGSVGEVHYVEKPSWPIDTTYFIKLKKNFDVDLKWFFRLLKTLRLPELSRSAAIPGLNRNDVYKIKIPLPPLNDQIRIAHLLGKVEALITRRKHHLLQLDELLKSVFLEMFGDPVRNERGWETEPLGSIATVERGRFSPRPRNDPKYYNGPYPFIQTGDINRANGRLSEYTQTLNELGIKVSKKFNVNTIVIAIVGATIGETAILQIPTYAPDSVIGITPKSITRETESVFIEFLLRFWKPELRAKAPEAARANINIETLRPLPTIRPLENERKKFATIIEKVEGIKTQYRQSLTELENLYGALNQKAFKGELDLSRIPMPVEPVEADKEPAKTEPESVLPEHKKHVEFSTPDQNQRMALSSAEGRKPVLMKWLDEYLQWPGKDAAFSVDSFMKEAQQKLDELDREAMLSGQGAEGAEPVLGINDYDHLKEWVFDQVRSGRIEQTRNLIKMDDKEELGNTIILKNA